MANFEAFCRVISSSINLLFLKSEWLIFFLKIYFFQNLDLTKHRLIYDGPLTMKLGDTKRFKTIDLHVVLLEDCIMLLQKQDDKYLLKFHTTTFGTTGAPQGQKFCHSPVIKFSTMLVRPVATGIYVIFIYYSNNFHSFFPTRKSLYIKVKLFEKKTRNEP